MILMARAIFHMFLWYDFVVNMLVIRISLLDIRAKKKWSQDISLKQSQAATRPWQLDSKDHPAPRKTSEASRHMRCIHNLMDFFLLDKSQPKLRFVGWRCVCVSKFVFWLEDI